MVSQQDRILPNASIVDYFHTSVEYLDGHGDFKDYKHLVQLTGLYESTNSLSTCMALSADGRTLYQVAVYPYKNIRKARVIGNIACLS